MLCISKGQLSIGFNVNSWLTFKFICDVYISIDIYLSANFICGVLEVNLEIYIQSENCHLNFDHILAIKFCVTSNEQRQQTSRT